MVFMCVYWDQWVSLQFICLDVCVLMFVYLCTGMCICLYLYICGSILYLPATIMTEKLQWLWLCVCVQLWCGCLPCVCVCLHFTQPCRPTLCVAKQGLIAERRCCSVGDEQQLGSKSSVTRTHTYTPTTAADTKAHTWAHTVGTIVYLLNIIYRAAHAGCVWLPLSHITQSGGGVILLNRHL